MVTNCLSVKPVSASFLIPYLNMKVFSSLFWAFFSVSLARAAFLDDNFNLGSTQPAGDEARTVGRGGIKMMKHRKKQTHCQPFHTTFAQGTVSDLSGVAPFVSVSPPDSYTASGKGLEMFLRRPPGPIIRQGHVNNVVADGATINSTFLVQ